MAFSIKFLSLQKAELDYEVELRGGTGGSVQELRKQIVKLSQQLPSEDILESHLAPSDDLKGVQESLLKSHSNLDTLKQRFDKNLFFRNETLLHHVYHRLNRISNVPEVMDNLYKTCMLNYHNQYKELSGLRPQTPQLRPATPVTASTSAEPTVISVTCERNLNADIGKLRFSGKTCVRSFILRVEEFVQSRGISFDKILSLAFEIFTDDALHWYRCNRFRIQCWNDLCQLLKEDFSTSNYDYRLSAEIRMRTQGESETITIYLSIMHGMFSRLDKPLSEEDKLEILLHNIRPCYASTLSAFPEIKTVDTLKNLCRNYENVQARFTHFHEPPKLSSGTVVPEFAYNPTAGTTSSTTNKYSFNNEKAANTYYNRNTFNKSNSSHDSKRSYDNNYGTVAALGTSAPKPTYCPRCRTGDHNLRNCKEERFLICFKCGRKDVRFSDCPVCNPKHGDDPKN